MYHILNDFEFRFPIVEPNKRTIREPHRKSQRLQKACVEIGLVYLARRWFGTSLRGQL